MWGETWEPPWLEEEAAGRQAGEKRMGMEGHGGQSHRHVPLRAARSPRDTRGSEQGPGLMLQGGSRSGRG